MERWRRLVLRGVCALTVMFAGSQPADPQTLVVSPSHLEFRMVQGGPLPAPSSFSVAVQAGSPVSWTGAVGGGFSGGVQLTPSSGTTPATVKVSFVSWWAGGRPPGEYSIPVIATPQAGTQATINVVLTVVARSPGPVFTYLAGPNGCTRPDGYADEALCVVPNEKPPGVFSPPPAGGSYTDPNFGAAIKVLTNARTTHAYSTPSPVSARNRYVMVFGAAGADIVYTASAKTAYQGVPGDFNTGAFWDAYDDEVYYYLVGAAVKRRDLRTGRTTTIAEYAGAPYGFTSITSGGTGDSSKDNWFAFFAPAQKQVCALDLDRGRTFCASYGDLGAVPISFVDYPLITKGVDAGSGKRYVLLMGNPSLAAFSVNLVSGKLDLEFRGPEAPEGSGNHDSVCGPGESCFGAPHADVFEDEKGIQYLVSTLDTQTPCERAVNTYRINSGVEMLTPVELGGGRTNVMTLFRCGGQAQWTGDHIGCAKRAPYCVVSTNYAGLRDPANQDPILRTPHLSEIFVMKGNGAEIRRLAQHRSVLFVGDEADGYWSRSRAAISPDGGFVVTDSNFGTQNAQRVVLITTGYGKPQVASAGLVNSASGQPPVAPGSYVTLFGSSFTSADCAAAAAQLPLPDVLCGTSVRVNGQPVRLHYVDPWQVNAILANTFPVGQPLQLQVSRGADLSPPFDVPVGSILQAAPAIFAYSLDDGVPRAIVSNSDWSLNGPVRADFGTRPLHPGEYGHIWANGLGPTTVFVADGTPAPSEPLAWTTSTVNVSVNGVSQPVNFSGLTPGLVALYQVDFVLDPGTPIKGGIQDVIWLNVGGVGSSPLTISLAPAG